MIPLEIIGCRATDSVMKKYSQLLLAGALLSLAFAPISLTGAGLISLAWLFYELTITKTHTQSFIKGWSYGIGFFGAGTSWIYVSIHTYGQANVWSSIFVTILFALFMGCYIACATFCFSLLFKRQNIWQQSIGFSVIWVIFEYIRANLFTGFPWVLLGFSQMVTPMKFLAPIIGVYGISFLTAFAACLLTITWLFLIQKNKNWVYPAVGMVALFIFPQIFAYSHWTKPGSNRIPVSIVQGNIAEDEKWLPNAFEKTVNRYVNLTKQVPKNSRIIVWPEGAIPVPYPQASVFLKHLSSFIGKNEATLVAGIPYANPKNSEQYYNAMILLGKSSGQYFKHHLVPFGEYFPSPIFREWMKWIGVSLYETGRGALHQPLLSIQKITTLPFICYEIAYADILLKSLPKAELLITISDDAWFGHSLARAQHLQIAQMRSLQSGRYQIVATNNGISAVIDAQGNIIKTVPSFETRILNSYIKSMSGSTPWAKIGDNTVMLVLIFLLCVSFLYRIRELY